MVFMKMDKFKKKWN